MATTRFRVVGQVGNMTYCVKWETGKFYPRRLSEGSLILCCLKYISTHAGMIINLQGGPRKVKPTTILLVTFECVGPPKEFFSVSVECV